MMTLVLIGILTLAFYIQQGGCFESSSAGLNRTYGGTGWESVSAAQQTADDGYIIVGMTNSFGAGGCDFWVVKIDSAGIMEWNKTYGGDYDDRALDVQQTVDGGYILVGTTESFRSGSEYSRAWLIKTDNNGNVEWNTTYPYVTAYDVQQTVDGGYILAGEESVAPGSSFAKFWIMKTDSLGNEEWSFCRGGGVADIYRYAASSVQQTADGDYIAVGSHNNNIVYGSPFPNENFIVYKIDSDGQYIWWQEYGGRNDVAASSVQQTADGGYIIAGAGSFGTQVNDDVWVVKTDAFGNMQWNQTYGGDGQEFCSDIRQTSDGGYIIVGSTYSFGSGDGDAYLIKIDSEGMMLWNKTFGGVSRDWGTYVQEINGGSYVVVGSTESFGAGENDFWIIPEFPSFLVLLLFMIVTLVAVIVCRRKQAVLGNFQGTRAL